MAHLYTLGAPQILYRDHKFDGDNDAFRKALNASTTLYVGNLSFFSTEEQIYELFSKCGEIKRIIMGIDRVKKTPCGFCFVEFYTKDDAGDCIKYLSGTKLDDRVIRVDWDAGFKEARQFGRGASGGQVRDEYRTDYDPGRGGYGRQVQLELTEREKAMLRYEPITEIPSGDRPAERPLSPPLSPLHASSASSSSLSYKRDRDWEESGSSAKRARRESGGSGGHRDRSPSPGDNPNPRFRESRDRDEDSDD